MTDETKLKEQLEELLPKEWREKFLATQKETILLDFTTEDCQLVNSKVGGRGYLPKSMMYPVTDEGQPLSLLAQINFEEMPDLEGFPTKGLLAFYINYYDDLTGLDFDAPTKQNGFRVLFFETLTEASYSVEEQEAVFDHIEEEVYSVVDKEVRLVGRLGNILPAGAALEFEQKMGMTCYDFVEKMFDSPEKEDRFLELLSFETCLGGYPGFTQCDPREGDSEREAAYDTLLFQLDSHDDYVMWGDSGIGNFFIHSEKLAAKDFSDVLYNWDCY